MMKATAISATLAAALIGCASGQTPTNEPVPEQQNAPAETAPADTPAETPAETPPADNAVGATEKEDVGESTEAMKAKPPEGDTKEAAAPTKKQGKASGCGAGGCGGSKKSASGTAAKAPEKKKQGKASGCGAGGCGGSKKAASPKKPTTKAAPKPKTGSSSACGAGTCG